MKSRAKIHIKGIVQGVGFRPFIYNLAHTHEIAGWVLNSTDGVHIEAEGTPKAVKTFIGEIRPKAPPLAVIDSIDVKYLPSHGYDEFSIRHSTGDESKYIKISPDVCICDDCLRELFDESDRRYRYPFINCTNCGPRYTIIEDIPYDRPKTTMKVFKMCPQCQEEYDNPMNRRFHAQPNACPVCGPEVWLEDKNSIVIGRRDDAIEQAIELFQEGRIVAVKGLGGFHLACDAQNEEAVSLLRERKRRVMKPFAIMSFSVEEVKSYCHVNSAEQKLLETVQRPVVLLEKLLDCSIAEGVATNNNYLGVMLPYTPLHYLLLQSRNNSQSPTLVMTSGNLSEEPIAIDNDEARERLAPLADYFLMHNRDICTRCDDSVTKVECELLTSHQSPVTNHQSPITTHTVMLRRSRGYAPYPIDLDFNMRQILACGAELKNTFCLTKENHVFLSQHIGDLQNAEAYKYYCDSIEYIKKLFRVEPEIVACDLHPEYLSTKYALEQENIEQVGVQHHHAHAVSCMAEHNLREPVIAVTFDGTGYGLDWTIWGGEFLIATEKDFQRVGHLKYLPLPGGDVAVKEPYRMALSYLYDAYGDELLNLDIPFVKNVERKKATLILQMIRKNINSPLTSSCGRLFDAVSALIGIRREVSYEAQAAIELEMLAHRAEEEFQFYSYRIDESNGISIINLREMFREITTELHGEFDVGALSAKFHNTVAKLTVDMCEKIRGEYHLDKVVLSGGCYQNRYLLGKTVSLLYAHNFNPYFQCRVPTNDGGICLGQAVIANQVVR